MPIVEFKMPKLGESITEAAIINWFKSVGDSVEKDEMLLEVATDKVDSEVPSPVTGVITEILHQPNEVIAIGQVLARIDSTEKIENKKEKKEVAKKVAKKENKAAALPKKQKIQPSNKNNNTFYSPLILSIAKEHHISYDELSRIPATGKEGRLRKSDVYNYLDSGRPYKFTQTQEVFDPTAYRIPMLELEKGTGKIVEMDRMRKMIADHMVYSKHVSPHVTAYIEADLTDLVEWRRNNKTNFQVKYGEKLTYTPLFIEAVANAIKEFPNINASIDGDKLIIKDSINIGMATALPSGNLIVPVVKNADKKNLSKLASEVNDLVDKARNNKLVGDEIKGSTFTISNVGTFGSLMGTPIINQPEVAILALGIIKKRAEVVEKDGKDEIAIRSMMYLSLSFDHRAVDGYLGGSFLRKVADNLEQFNLNRPI